VEKKSRRSKTKYKNIDPNFNVKSRKDYLEGYNYINGVRNKDGETVIRELTEEEKEWLDKFYAETIVTDFYHTPELKQAKKTLSNMELKIGKEIKSENIIELEEEIKLTKDEDSLKRLNKKLIRLYKNIGKKESTDELEALRSDLRTLQSDQLLYSNPDDQKEIYRENNIRNKCLYNYSKKQGNLIGLDLYEFDRFSSESEKSIDPENILISSEIEDYCNKLDNDDLE